MKGVTDATMPLLYVVYTETETVAPTDPSKTGLGYPRPARYREVQVEALSWTHPPGFPITPRIQVPDDFVGKQRLYLVGVRYTTGEKSAAPIHGSVAFIGIYDTRKEAHEMCVALTNNMWGPLNPPWVGYGCHKERVQLWGLPVED